MENIGDFIEWGFIALLGAGMGIARKQFEKLSVRIDGTEKELAEIDKRTAIIETKMDSNKEHIDQRFDSLDKRFDVLFERFEQYDRDRSEFFEKFDLRPKK